MGEFGIVGRQTDGTLKTLELRRVRGSSREIDSYHPVNIDRECPEAYQDQQSNPDRRAQLQSHGLPPLSGLIRRGIVIVTAIPAAVVIQIGFREVRRIENYTHDAGIDVRQHVVGAT